MFQELLERLATALDAAGFPYMVVHKMIAGRPRDLEDIKGVLRRNQALDRRAVTEWLAQFEEVVGRPLVQEFEALAESAASRR
jgi:hypothetical protein